MKLGYSFNHLQNRPSMCKNFLFVNSLIQKMGSCSCSLLSLVVTRRVLCSRSCCVVNSIFVWQFVQRGNKSINEAILCGLRSYQHLCSACVKHQNPRRTSCAICDGQCLKKTLGYEETDRQKDREIKEQLNMDKTFNIAVAELKPCAGPSITQGLVQIRRLDAKKLARILGLWNSKGHQRTPTR